MEVVTPQIQLVKWYRTIKINQDVHAHTACTARLYMYIYIYIRIYTHVCLDMRTYCVPERYNCITALTGDELLLCYGQFSNAELFLGAQWQVHQCDVTDRGPIRSVEFFTG